MAEELFTRFPSIKVFCEAEINEVFVVVVAAKIGVALLILVEQTGEESIGEVMADFPKTSPGLVFSILGLCDRAGSRELELGARARIDPKTQTGPGFGAGKAVTAQVADVIARNEGVGDHLGAENLADIVTEAFPDFVVKSAEVTTEINRLFRVRSGLMAEDDSPQEAFLVGAEIVADLGVQLQLVGNRPVHAGTDGVIEAVAQIRPQGAVQKKRLETQIFALGDEADIDLIAETGKPPVALIVPEVFVRRLDAQPRLADGQALGLSTDDIAVVKNVRVVVLIAPAVTVGERASIGAKTVAPRTVHFIESAALEQDGLIADIIREAGDADVKIVSENHIPAPDVGIPGDLGTNDGLIAQAEDVGSIEAKARDARFILQRQIDKGSGEREAESFGQLGDDRAADRDDGDRAGLAVGFQEIDIVAPQDRSRDGMELEKDGTQFEIGVLGFKAALQQRKGSMERQRECGAGFDGFRSRRGCEGDGIQRVRVGGAGVAEKLGIRHAHRWRRLVRPAG